MLRGPDLLYEIFHSSLTNEERVEHSIHIMRLSKGHDWHYVVTDDRWAGRMFLRLHCMWAACTACVGCMAGPGREVGGGG